MQQQQQQRCRWLGKRQVPLQQALPRQAPQYTQASLLTDPVEKAEGKCSGMRAPMRASWENPLRLVKSVPAGANLD